MPNLCVRFYFALSWCASAIISTGFLSLSGDSSIQVVDERAITHLMRDDWRRYDEQLWSQTLTTPMHYLASFLIASVIFRIHTWGPWSARRVGHGPSKQSVNRRPAHITSRHSLWVVPYAISALFKELDRYSTGFFVLLNCSFNNT